MGNRPSARAAPPPPPARRRHPRVRMVALLGLLALIFVALRTVAGLPPAPTTSDFFTDHVVVVGVTGRPELTDVDRQVLGTHLDDAQAGAVSIRPRYVGDCAAAGWTTLGAGRRAAVGGVCLPPGGAHREHLVVGDWDAPPAAPA